MGIKEKMELRLAQLIENHKEFQNAQVRKNDYVVFTDILRIENNAHAVLYTGVYEINNLDGKKVFSKTVEFHQSEITGGFNNCVKFVKDVANKYDAITIFVDDRGIGIALKESLRQQLVLCTTDCRFVR